MIALNERLAAHADIPELRGLMNAAIGELLKPFLSPDEIAASFHVMGLDTKLIEDETYFVIESGGSIVGCGGWGRRAPRFGGGHSARRPSAVLPPRQRTAPGRGP